MTDELLAEHSTRLDKQAAVERLVRDTKRGITRMLHREPAADLFGRPILKQFLSYQLLEPEVDRQQTRLRPVRVPPRPIIGATRTVSPRAAVATDLPTDRRR